MRKLILLLSLFIFHLNGFSQTCEIIVGGSVTIDFSNFAITKITNNGSDCTLDYSLDYQVNNPAGCGVNLQAVFKASDGSQTNFVLNTDGSRHTQTGKIYNTLCEGTGTIFISGDWGHPCTYQSIPVPYPGTPCLSTAYGTPTLPVELINFEANKINGKVQLNWTTASENNNDQFIIEQSNDNLEYKEIGAVAGAGTSNTLNQYSFLHDQPFVGINYYRLKQLDLNGTFEYSNIISVRIKFLFLIKFIIRLEN